MGPTLPPSFVPIMRDGLPPREARGKPLLFGPEYDVRRERGLIIERNIPVPLRDGVRIYVDLYRAEGDAGAGPLPAILGWSPYGKHNLSNRLWPAAGVDPEWLSPLTAFEAPDPTYWCPRGYAVVYADPRGTWYSEGEMRHGGIEESLDCYDLIEWLGTCDWCNGKVGLSGVSYLAAIQWQVGPLRPPHLAALNPWEGFSDWYREFGYHGGIRETRFVPAACGNLNWSTTRTEDTDANMRAHPLWDAYWASKECALEEIEAPIFIVASWSDQGLHLRGTLEAYKRVSSPQKWIEIHGRKKWAHYYTPANVERLRVFFDRFLKGIGDGPLSWPKVQLEVRERAYVGTVRAESEWPLQRTRFRKLFLDASRALLADEAPPSESVVRYDSTAADGQAVFDYRFDRDAELTGHAKLLLWVEAEGADDMDLFVALQKLDGNGHAVGFVFYAMYENGPVALGWLRASHRALDPLRSRPEQPVHPHTREERLERGEIVPVEIEIWPFSTLFRAGERLRVVVKGRDIYAEAPPTQPFALHQETRNAGFHVIHTGGAYDSHLLVPEIPAEDSSGGRGSMSRTLTEADFRDYIAAFNRDDFDGFARYYADDVIFEGRGRHFRSRDEVVAFYRMVKRRMRETITIRDVIADEHAIAAEIETELQALKDWPDFVTGPVVAGQRIRTVNFVWYRLGDGNFTHVRSARYRKIE